MSNSASNELTREEFLIFPKPRLQPLVTATGEQLKRIWILTLSISAVCGGVYLFNEFAALLFAVVLLPGLALISLIFQVWYFTQRSRIRSLESGDYYVNWPIAPEPWKNLIAQRAVNAAIPGTFAKWFGGTTLFMVTMYYFLEDTVFFDSTILHFVLPTVVVVIVSYLVGLIVLVFTGMTDRIMRTHAPQLVVGPGGIYMTGTFRPTATLDQKLVSTEVIQEDCVLACKYRIATRHGVEFRVVRYPYPSNRTEEAHCVANLLNDPAAGDVRRD